MRFSWFVVDIWHKSSIYNIMFWGFFIDFEDL